MNIIQTIHILADFNLSAMSRILGNDGLLIVLLLNALVGADVLTDSATWLLAPTSFTGLLFNM